MITEIKPLAEINRQAIRVLYQELGVVNAVRFLKQFTVGFGNYMQDRELIFANKTVDEISQEIQQKPTNEKTAEPYQHLAPEKREQLLLLISSFLQEFPQYSPESVLEMMRQMSREARAKGLTPDVLDSLLSDE